MVAVFGIIQFVAVLSAVLFTGAAFYIILVERPPAMGGGPQLTIKEWLPSGRLGIEIQSVLAGLGGLTGLLAWLMCGGILWVIGAFFIFAAIPFVLLAITPRGKQVLDAVQGSGADEMEALLKKRRRLHLVRSVLGFVASCIYFALVVKT